MDAQILVLLHNVNNPGSNLSTSCVTVKGVIHSGKYWTLSEGESMHIKTFKTVDRIRHEVWHCWVWTEYQYDRVTDGYGISSSIHMQHTDVSANISLWRCAHLIKPDLANLVDMYDSWEVDILIRCDSSWNVLTRRVQRETNEPWLFTHKWNGTPWDHWTTWWFLSTSL